MKSVTMEQIRSFNPCWLKTANGRKRLDAYEQMQSSWTALEVLAREEIDAADRLWAVLREEFIDAPILHEFACKCAERALSAIANPDPRSVAAIQAKRAWLRGEIGDEEMEAARKAAGDAAWEAAWDATRDAARDAAWCAAEQVAQDAVRGAAWCAAWAWQVATLTEMLREETP